MVVDGVGAGDGGRGDSPAEWCPFPAENRADVPGEGADKYLSPPTPPSHPPPPPLPAPVLPVAVRREVRKVS